MKTLILFCLSLIGTGLFTNSSTPPEKKFFVFKQTTNCVCKVQEEIERPLFGVKHLGPYKTKEEATKAMCKDLDPEMEDRTKCWATLPAKACDKK